MKPIFNVFNINTPQTHKAYKMQVLHSVGITWFLTIAKTSANLRKKVGIHKCVKTCKI